MTGLGLFGKLPAKGDFVTRNLSTDFLRPFETWLAGTVEGARDALGDDWADIYDFAPVWRFWIGPETGLPACAGVLAASRDRVGRRYPLVIVTEGGPRGEGLPMPPVVGEDEGWFAALEAALARAMDEDFGSDPGDVLVPPPGIAAGYGLPDTVGLGDPRRIAWAVGPAPRNAVPPRAAEPGEDDPPSPADIAETVAKDGGGTADPWAAVFDGGPEDASPFDAEGGLLDRPDPGIEDASPFDDPDPVVLRPRLQAALGMSDARLAMFPAAADPPPEAAPLGMTEDSAADQDDDPAADGEPEAVDEDRAEDDSATVLEEDDVRVVAGDADDAAEAGDDDEADGDVAVDTDAPADDVEEAVSGDAGDAPAAPQATVPPSRDMDGDPDTDAPDGDMPTGALGDPETAKEDADADAAPDASGPATLRHLLSGATGTEAALHALGRSYWWTRGDARSPAAFMAISGLPDGPAFAALLGGFRSAALANDPE